MTLPSSMEFDKFLSGACVKPEWIIVHPKIWNGYWYIDGKSMFSSIYKWLGRKLHSRRIFWLGLRLVWVNGLRYYVDPDKWKLNND